MSGMLGSLLQGVGQGVQTIGQAGMRYADKTLDEDIANRRARMLADLQREYKGLDREDQAAFSDARAPVVLEQEQKRALAASATATEAETRRLGDAGLNSAKDEEAKRVAQRAIDAATQKLNDPGLTAAEQKAAQRELAEAKERFKAMIPLKVAEATAVANATASANSRGDNQRMVNKGAQIEAFIGRKLTPAEREAMAGLGKSDNVQAMRTKLAEEVVSELIKTGQVPPGDRAKAVQAQMASYTTIANELSLREDVLKSRKDGDLGRLVTEARSIGRTDGELLAAGLTKEELKRANAAPAKPAGTGMLEQIAPTTDPLLDLDTRTLRRIAAIQGHTNQAAAIAELKRRESQEGEAPMTDAVTMMNRGF